MSDRQHITIIRQVVKALKAAIFSLLALFMAVLFIAYDHFGDQLDPTIRLAENKEQAPEIVDGIHVETGLVEGEGMELVIQNCTNCHSSKLITQNRMTKEGWLNTIKWMQETQNLWDLGKNEAIIVTYLASNYAPQKKGRRAPLKNIEWYELD